MCSSRVKDISIGTYDPRISLKLVCVTVEGLYEQC